MMAEAEPARVAWRSYHDWVLPVRAVQAILAGALLFLFLGLVLLAVGGAVQVGGLVAAGAVLAGIGGCGLLVCLLLCLHAYFIFNVRDQANQTTDAPWSDDVLHSANQEIPGYAVVNKPSSLKSADTLRRNGGGSGIGGGGNGGIKKVTMAPDVALDADVRAPGLRNTGGGDFAGSSSAAAAGTHVSLASPNLALASPTSPGYRMLGTYAVIDHGGVGGGAGGQARRGVSGSGSVATMEAFDQRSYAQHQQVQDMQQQQLKQQQQVNQQTAVQRQRADTDIQRQRQQLELHRQHLMQQQQHKQQQQHHQQQHQQQQQQHFRVQQQHQQPSSSGQSVSYAQIQRYPIPVQHSPSPSMSSQQSSVFTTGSITGGGGGGGGVISGFGTGTSSMGGVSSYGGTGTGTSFGTATGSPVGTAKTSSSFSSYRIQTEGLQYQSGRPYSEEDGDYDNPAENTPMLVQHGGSAAGAHHHHAQHHHHHQQQQQHHLQHQQQQHNEASSKGVSFSGSVRSVEPDVPEPAPLQHPSERRPMTFEQQSSSKMSIYDNVLFPYAEAEGE